MNNHFSKLYSIELSKGYFEAAKKKLKNFNKINLYFGDSRKILPKILENINEPCVFWLDAHFSGGKTAKIDKTKLTPIKEELLAIKNHHIKEHIIFIDDIRCFDGKNGFPTKEETRKILSEINKNYSITYDKKTDILMATLTFAHSS